MSPSHRTFLDYLTDIGVIGIVIVCLGLLLSGVTGYQAEAMETKTRPAQKKLTPRTLLQLNERMILSVEEPSLPIMVNLSPPVQPPPAPPAVQAPRAPSGAVDTLLWSRILVVWKKFYPIYKTGQHPCEQHESLFETARKLSGLPAALIAGVASVESRCQSVSGGWMQIQEVSPTSLKKSMRLLGASSGFSPRSNPLHAVVSGAIILKDLEKELHDRTAALLAYNIGIGAYGTISGSSPKPYQTLRARLPARNRDHLPVALAHALLLSRKWEGATPEPVPGPELMKRLASWL